MHAGAAGNPPHLLDLSGQARRERRVARCAHFVRYNIAFARCAQRALNNCPSWSCRRQPQPLEPPCPVASSVPMRCVSVEQQVELAESTHSQGFALFTADNRAFSIQRAVKCRAWVITAGGGGWGNKRSRSKGQTGCVCARGPGTRDEARLLRSNTSRCLPSCMFPPCCVRARPGMRPPLPLKLRLLSLSRSAPPVK